MSFDRRILVWSQRGLDLAPFRCVAYEFEDVIVEVERGAGIVSPAPFVRSPPGRLRNLVLRDLGLRVPGAVGYRKETADDGFDLFFADIQFPIDLDSLRAMSGWRHKARHAVCLIDEFWARDIARWKSLPRFLDGFDHIFLECSGTVADLERVTGIPCSYMAPGVDALRFCPPPAAPARVVDVCRFGRRDYEIHRALLDACLRGEIFYEFDTIRPERVWSIEEHREHLAAILQRSRYALVSPGKQGADHETDGQEELAYRFFEGAAAGTVMLGSAPQNSFFSQYFDWPDAVVELDGRSVLDTMKVLDGDPVRVDVIRRANMSNSLRRHDWLYRWQQVLDTVGLPATDRMRARQGALQDRASQIESTMSSG